MRLSTIAMASTATVCFIILFANHRAWSSKYSASASLSAISTVAAGSADDDTPEKVVYSKRLAQPREGTTETFDLKQYYPQTVPTMADVTERTTGQLSTGLSWSLVRTEQPRVLYLNSILSHEDCDALVEVGNRRVQRSTVIHKEGSAVDEYRTSFGMFLQYPGEEDHPANIRLRTNGAKMVGVPMSNIESTQMLRYYKGQQYKVHPDYFDKWDEADLKRGGQRIATVLTWLTDVPKGGATTFPMAGASFPPKKGDAVLFYDVDYNNVEDIYSSHAAEPPEGDSVKWVAVQWIHPKPFQ